jgi:hypothetical protein
MNIADKIREYQRWNKLYDTNPTRLADEKDTDLYLEVIDALDAAGLLVFGGYGYFPHPDWEQRIQALDDLDEEDKAFIRSYIEEEYNESLWWLESIQEDGIERAIIAYAKLAKTKGFAEQPDRDLSTVEEHDGRMWVRLCNSAGGDLARYIVNQTSPAQVNVDDPSTWWRDPDDAALQEAVNDELIESAHGG